jgi:hypothetical protein
LLPLIATYQCSISVGQAEGERLKTDDPQLEKARKEMIERNDKMDKLTLATLRSHLLVEQSMNDHIVGRGVKRKWLIKKRFWDKMQKCKTLAKEEGQDPLWDVLDAANHLRNAIGHTLSVGRIAEKMVQLKEKYLASLTEKQAAGLKGQPDDVISLNRHVSIAPDLLSPSSCVLAVVNRGKPLRRRSTLKRIFRGNE